MTATEVRAASDWSDRRYNAALAIAIIVGGVLLFGLARWVAVDRSPFPDGSDGAWSTTSVLMDGEVVEVELSLRVALPNGGWGGACNSFTLEGRRVVSTLAECVDDPAGRDLMEIDVRLEDAILAGGELDETGDRMTFDDDGFVVTFERSAP